VKFVVFIELIVNLAGIDILFLNLKCQKYHIGSMFLKYLLILTK